MRVLNQHFTTFSALLVITPFSPVQAWYYRHYRYGYGYPVWGIVICALLISAALILSIWACCYDSTKRKKPEERSQGHSFKSGKIKNSKGKKSKDGAATSSKKDKHHAPASSSTRRPETELASHATTRSTLYTSVQSPLAPPPVRQVTPDNLYTPGPVYEGSIVTYV